MVRILVVDDEPDVVEYISDLLENAGWQPVGAANGVEAVLKVLDGACDIVLMDIRMPKLDGINALRIIKRINPALPVIMFTGQAGQGDMYESTRLGAFTCLMKPVTQEKLLQVTTQAMNYSHLHA